MCGPPGPLPRVSCPRSLSPRASRCGPRPSSRRTRWRWSARLAISKRRKGRVGVALERTAAADSPLPLLVFGSKNGTQERGREEREWGCLLFWASHC